MATGEGETARRRAPPLPLLHLGPPGEPGDLERVRVRPPDQGSANGSLLHATRKGKSSRTREREAEKEGRKGPEKKRIHYLCYRDVSSPRPRCQGLDDAGNDLDCGRAHDQNPGHGHGRGRVLVLARGFCRGRALLDPYFDPCFYPGFCLYSCLDAALLCPRHVMVPAVHEKLDGRVVVVDQSRPLHR
eukprot:m.81457 g.81457  ORF g.81457 m.81457 type:complete len:188 (+) comp14250_c0_seq3:1451-2014(+)